MEGLDGRLVAVHGRHLVPGDAQLELLGLPAHPLGVGLVGEDDVLAELKAAADEDCDSPLRQAEHVHVPADLGEVVERDLCGARGPPLAAIGVGLKLQPADHATALEEQPVRVAELPVPVGVGVDIRPGLDDLVLRVLVREPVRHAGLQDVAAGLVVGLRVGLDEPGLFAPQAVPGLPLGQADDRGDVGPADAVPARLVPLGASRGPPAEEPAGGCCERDHQNGGSSSHGVRALGSRCTSRNGPRSRSRSSTSSLW